MAFAPRFTITNATTAALTEIERARGYLEAAALAEEWVDAMRSEAFVREAHHTTNIEGNRLTPEEAASLLVGTAGLEPARLAAHDPKSCSSSSSDTSP